MEEQKLKINIEIVGIEKDEWSIGICLSHSIDETYVYINLVKWIISIGKFRK